MKFSTFENLPLYGHLYLYFTAEINDHLANSPAYIVAMECITYLLKEGLEADKIFRIPGNVGKLKRYLEVIDSYKVSELTILKICKMYF